MTVRIYGHTGAHDSYCVVTDGFVRTMRAAGLLEGIYSLSEAHEWDEPDLGRPPEWFRGAEARVALFTGRLDLASRMVQFGKHEVRWAMVAPNSTAMPPRLMRDLNDLCTGLLVPSEWAATVLREYTELPILVVPHGLSPETRPDPQPTRTLDERGFPARFVVRHFSSSDRQRKGTREVVRAWESLRERGVVRPGMRLILVLHRHALTTVDPFECEELDITVEERQEGGMSAAQMSAVLRETDLVLQPSRAEAFGLIPLEALASGTPVVATGCTGHAQYLDALSVKHGVVKVPTGPLHVIDDLPEEGSMAPHITSRGVTEALVFALDIYPTLKSAALERAERVRAVWSWEKQLAPLVQKIQEGGP